MAQDDILVQSYEYPIKKFADVTKKKDGNLSIPLYVTSETTQTSEENAAFQATAIPEAFTVWLKSYADFHTALAAIPDGASR